MKKINILKESREFSRIIKKYSSIKYKDYIVYIEKNTGDIYHFGFSVSKKIGNAVTRNKIKRRIKNILDENSYQNNFNCIIIVRKSILDKSFSEMKEDLFKLCKKIDILKGEDYEK